jgi:hypothetical protein
MKPAGTMGNDIVRPPMAPGYWQAVARKNKQLPLDTAVFVDASLQP